MNRVAPPSERMMPGFHPDWPVQNIIQRLGLWHRRHRTRQQLRQLAEHQLPDLGLTEPTRRIECKKWFWQR